MNQQYLIKIELVIDKTIRKYQELFFKKQYFFIMGRYNRVGSMKLKSAIAGFEQFVGVASATWFLESRCVYHKVDILLQDIFGPNVFGIVTDKARVPMEAESAPACEFRKIL